MIGRDSSQILTLRDFGWKHKEPLDGTGNMI